MSKLLCAMAMALIACSQAVAQRFDTFFRDSTLRLDYIFAGDASRQAIYVDELGLNPRWHGRRARLGELPLGGNGRLTVRDCASGEVIYRHSFSTLFQEWLLTAEAKTVAKSFENVFLVPWPKQPVSITVELRDSHDSVTASMTHTVNPADILIRRRGFSHVTPYKTLQRAADTTRCIHIAYVAEGYRADEMDAYLDDAQAATEAIFAHEPFRRLRSRFNVVAVMSPSEDSGASCPADGVWKSTALRSHFDTFYSDRYLTTLSLKRLHDLLAGTPYEHIIILVNTAKYGGGGIYNSYNLSYTKGDDFRPVVVHEFGHSFGGLGDEYEYGDGDPMYHADTEPWEPNLTTKRDFRGKWENLLRQGKATLIEGGGYQQKGVYRGAADCRMRTNDVPDFCPVCQQALERMIEFYTGE